MGKLREMEALYTTFVLQGSRMRELGVVLTEGIRETSSGHQPVTADPGPW